MRLRRFNEVGLQRMGEFLDTVNDPQPTGLRQHLLTDPALSEEVGGEIEDPPRQLGSRLEGARYLDGILSAAGLRDPGRDRGLWSWLALFFFEEMCPRGRDGRRRPGERPRWVLEVDNYQRYYRHLLAGPYYIYRAHRDAPERALAVLVNPVSSPGEIVEQLASRQELVTSRTVMQLVTDLYIDPSTGRARRGATSKNPERGGARRLAEVLNQLDVVWDLYGMAPAELMNRLPSEFDRFRPRPTAQNSQPAATS
jgi:hypothetical protein